MLNEWGEREWKGKKKREGEKEKGGAEWEVFGRLIPPMGSMSVEQSSK